MRSKRKRHPITLLEIMIVILLIGVIGGVLSYNLKGSLDRGKKFRTEEGKKRLKEILELEIEQGYSTTSLVGPTDVSKVKECITNSGLVPPGNIDSFIKDGWNDPYFISEKNGTIEVYSHRLDHIDKNGNRIE